jgi:hypothetical protein
MLRSVSLFCVLLGTATAFADGDALVAGTIPRGDAIVERPLTLPATKMAIYGDLDVVKVDLGGFTATSEQIHGGLGYGVTDQLTVGVDYAFPLHDSASGTFAGMTTSQSNTLPGNGRGPLMPYASYRLLHGPLSLAVSGGLLVNLAGQRSVDAMGNPDFTTTYSIVAGAVLKYDIAPTIAVYTGTPLAGNEIGLAGSPFGPGPLGNQLQIGLSSDSSGNSMPSILSLPAGIAFQATPQLFAFAQTTLMAAYVANAPMGADSLSFIGSSAIPFTAGAFFSVSHKLEIGGTLSFPDLQHAGDLYLFGIAARLNSGK